jgi:hypothetical protein
MLKHLVKQQENSNSKKQVAFNFHFSACFCGLCFAFLARNNKKKFILNSLFVSRFFTLFLQIKQQFFFQSQFRFDNECYLNLPDNHKRVSLTPRASFDLNSMDVTSMITDDNEDGDGSNVVVARTPAAISANESNFNLVYDDFNLASVSMPFFLYLFTLSFVIFVCLLRLKA